MILATVEVYLNLKTIHPKPVRIVEAWRLKQSILGWMLNLRMNPMAKKKETIFKENRVHVDLKALRKETKGLLWFTKTQQRTIRGTPDEILFVAGVPIAIELKRDSSVEADSLQGHTLERIILAGGYGFVACPENWNLIMIEIRKVIAAHGPSSLESLARRIKICDSINKKAP